MKQKTWIYGGMVCLQAFVYGLGNALTKIAYESITPFWGMSFRFGLAFLIFLAIRRKHFFANVRNLPLASWLPCSICLAVAYITCNMALDMTTATNVGFFISLSILFVPFAEMLFLHRKYSFKYFPAQGMVVIGLYLLCCNSGTFTFGAGEALGLISSIATAGSLVFGEKSLAKLDVVTLCTLQVGVAFLGSILGALFFEPEFQLTAVSPSAWLVLAYLASGSTCLAFWLQNKALTGISSTQVSVILCSEPVFTAAISWVLLSEVLSGIGFMGTAIIVLCILLETWVISATGDNTSKRKEKIGTAS